MSGTGPILSGVVRFDIRKVLEGFDQGVFVRSIAGDDEAGWAVRVVPYLAALARLQSFAELEPAEPEPEPNRGAV